MRYPALRQATLDRVEQSLRCSSRYCAGQVRVALTYDDLNAPFVGGLA